MGRFTGALNLVKDKKLPIAATIAGGAALGTSEESEAKVLTTLPNLIRLGMLTPDSAKNPSAVKSAHTKYNKALKESKAFKAREKLREDIENKTQSLDLGDIQTLDPNTLVGKVGVPVTGDTSVTGKTIHTIGGVELDAPVYVEGGPQFPKRFQDQGYGWASMKDAANKKQTNIKRAREATEGADVVGVFSAMSRKGINFSTPIAEALYKQAINLPITAKDVKEFDKRVRYGPKGSQAKNEQGRKDWVGLHHPDALDQLLGLGDYPRKGAGEIRKQFVETMDLAQFRNRGFPIKEDVYAETIEPALQTAKIGDAGFSVFKAAPDQSTFQAPVHQSYDTIIPGEYLGQFEQNIPSRIMFPEIYKKLDTKTNKHGELLPEDQKLGSLMMTNDLYEPFTEQWADEVSNYMRLPRGSADPGLLMQMAGYGGIAANKLLDGLEYLERPQQSLKGALAEGGEGAVKGLLGEEKYKWGYDKPVTRGFGRYGVGRQVMTPEQQELYSDLMLDPLDLVFGAVGKAGGALSKFIRRSDSP